MGRVMIEHLNKLQGWVFQSRSQMEKILSGTGTPGTRAAPTQAGNNDANIGLRLDYGEIFNRDGKMYQRVNLQVNKGAENPTLKALGKNSHEVWSHADVLIQSEQVASRAATVSDSAGQAVPTTGGPSGHKTSAQANPVKPNNSLGQLLLKEGAEQVFEDLEANMKD